MPQLTFERIAGITLIDNVTGEYWVWNWDFPAGSVPVQSLGPSPNGPGPHIRGPKPPPGHTGSSGPTGPTGPPSTVAVTWKWAGTVTPLFSLPPPGSESNISYPDTSNTVSQGYWKGIVWVASQPNPPPSGFAITGSPSTTGTTSHSFAAWLVGASAPVFQSPSVSGLKGNANLACPQFISLGIGNYVNAGNPSGTYAGAYAPQNSTLLTLENVSVDASSITGATYLGHNYTVASSSMVFSYLFDVNGNTENDVLLTVNFQKM